MIKRYILIMICLISLGYAITSMSASSAVLSMKGVESFGATLGIPVASGDINGDGMEDVITYSAGKIWNEKVYAIYGGTIGNVSLGYANLTISGIVALNIFSNAVATGDINNDGSDDLIIRSSPYYIDFIGYPGNIFIYYSPFAINGSLSVSQANVTLQYPYGTESMAVASGDINHDGNTDVIVAHEDKVYVLFSPLQIIGIKNLISVANVTIDVGNNMPVDLEIGDVNGDGSDDIVIGETHSDSWTGTTYVVFGYSGINGTVNGANITIVGADAGDYSGKNVAVGDINNDGKGDIIIGATGGDPNGKSNAGETYVVFGGVTGTKQMPTDADLILNGEVAGDSSGITASGDVNNDGIDDIIIGAPSDDLKGKVYVVLGGGVSGTIDLSAADLIMSGENNNDNLGTAVASGDVDGDGQDDLIVSSTFGSQPVPPSPGKTYVVTGIPFVGFTYGEEDVLFIKGEPHNIYAEYEAGGVPITGATCITDINNGVGTVSMTWDAIDSRYEYSLHQTQPDGTLYKIGITCSKSGYDTKTSQLNFRQDYLNPPHGYNMMSDYDTFLWNGSIGDIGDPTQVSCSDWFVPNRDYSVGSKYKIYTKLVSGTADNSVAKIFLNDDSKSGLDEQPKITSLVGECKYSYDAAEGIYTCESTLLNSITTSDAYWVCVRNTRRLGLWSAGWHYDFSNDNMNSWMMYANEQLTSVAFEDTDVTNIAPIMIFAFAVPAVVPNAVAFNSISFDLDGDATTKYFCKTDAFAGGACTGGEWCHTTGSTCTYGTTNADAGVGKQFWAFVYDGTDASVYGNTFTVVTNAAPSLTGLTDNDGEASVSVGQTLTFTSAFTDAEKDSVTNYICSTNSLTHGVGCDATEFCHSHSVTSPKTCMYVVSLPAWTNQTYYGFADDAYGKSASLFGTFNVRPGVPPAPIICGDDICANGEWYGSCPADCKCGDGICDPTTESKVICAVDCHDPDPICNGDGDCDGVGVDGETQAKCPDECGPVCGNGACEPTENCDVLSCPQDCGPCDTCDADGVCEAGETASDCLLDCFCGNAICDPEEDCASCVGDCGICPVPPPKCGDGVCDPGEDCLQDCGPPVCVIDGVCDINENVVSCPADCFCGDGVCGDGELCGDTDVAPHCKSDCGKCNDPVPICGDGLCSIGETAADCPVDCGCGNGVCESGETCGNCPADCGTLCPPPPPVCGDASCDPGETCNSCSADCSGGDCDPTCGDGTCDAAEACDNCQTDCGICNPTCGDGTCNPGESITSCPADCNCQDSHCEPGETCDNCASDCGKCDPTCGDGTCGAGENYLNCPDTAGGDCHQAWCGVWLNPSNPGVDDNLLCSYTYHDDDADPEGATVAKWYKNSVLFTTVTGAGSPKTLDKSSTSAGDTWYCSVQPNDGSAMGTICESNTVVTGLAVTVTAPITSSLTTIPLTFGYTGSAPQYYRLSKDGASWLPESDWASLGSYMVADCGPTVCSRPCTKTIYLDAKNGYSTYDQTPDVSDTVQLVVPSGFLPSPAMKTVAYSGGLSYVIPGNTVTFTFTTTSGCTNNQHKALICSTPSQSGGSCTATEFCSSVLATGSSHTCAYTADETTPNGVNYAYIYVCDAVNVCTTEPSETTFTAVQKGASTMYTQYSASLAPGQQQEVFAVFKTDPGGTNIAGGTCEFTSGPWSGQPLPYDAGTGTYKYTSAVFTAPATYSFIVTCSSPDYKTVISSTQHFAVNNYASSLSASLLKTGAKVGTTQTLYARYKYANGTAITGATCNVTVNNKIIGVTGNDGTYTLVWNGGDNAYEYSYTVADTNNHVVYETYECGKTGFYYHIATDATSYTATNWDTYFLLSDNYTSPISCAENITLQIDYSLK